MNRLKQIRLNKLRRANRVRHTINGTAERPRLGVHISNKHISAQLIDDANQQTLAYVTTVGRKLEGSMSVKAELIGTEIAKKSPYGED